MLKNSENNRTEQIGLVTPTPAQKHINQHTTQCDMSAYC